MLDFAPNALGPRPTWLTFDCYGTLVQWHEALGAALARVLRLRGEAADGDALVEAVSAIPPFPEVPGTLARLKAAGFRTCITSNTDRDVIAGTLALLGAERVDRVVTAEQARAYKPAAAIFEYAWSQLGTVRAEVFHGAAGIRVDLAAARGLGFRAAWVDRGTGDAPLPDYPPRPHRHGAGRRDGSLRGAGLDGVLRLTRP